MKRLFKALKRNTKGAVAIEYGLLIALIAMSIIAVLSELGAINIAMFDSISDTISAQTPT
ncbi:MAG: Flp family type IVb pilin [Sphingomonadales bacterium]|nr:Flp family type IVb pilin [Sphingomonadales bacterium]